MPNASPGLCRVGRGASRPPSGLAPPFSPGLGPLGNVWWRKTPQCTHSAHRGFLFSLTRHVHHTLLPTQAPQIPQTRQPCGNMLGRARRHLRDHHFRSRLVMRTHTHGNTPVREHTELSPAVKCPSPRFPLNLPFSTTPSQPFGGDQMKRWRRWGFIERSRSGTRESAVGVTLDTPIYFQTHRHTQQHAASRHL